MKISIIGSGNVAHHLGTALKNAGDEILQVVGRNAAAVKELANLLEAEAVSDLDALNLKSDVVLICVKDDAIAAVAESLPNISSIVAHTSGFRSMQLLRRTGENFGIFYPLQTMRKGVPVNFGNVPFLIEGSNVATADLLTSLAHRLSPSVHKVSELQRQYIHLAAVFANNFTNHLWELSAHLLKENQVDFDLLRPLIARSAENVAEKNPADLRTGPAARKDFFTIEAHRNLLQSQPRMLKVYEVLTDSMLSQFSE